MLPLRKVKNTSTFPQISLGAVIKLLLFTVFAVAIIAIIGSSKKESEISDPELIRKTGTVKLSELLAVGIGLSDQAAKVIQDVKKAHKENMHVKGLTAEGVIEPVTDADQRSNKIFVNGYRNHFPGIEILSEETEPEADTNIKSFIKPNIYSFLDHDRILDVKDIVITIDPLDATKEFTEDLLEYVTTMVCIVKNGRPIAGIINQVFEDKPAVVGIVGNIDDWTDGTIFGRDERHSTYGESDKIITISRSHTGAGEDVVSKYFPGRKSLQAGGAGYKALLVLDGKANAYIHVTKIKSWDVCAAEAVLRANGGMFSDIFGKELTYSTNDPVFTDGIVATQAKDIHHWYVNQLDGNMS